MATYTRNQEPGSSLERGTCPTTRIQVFLGYFLLALLSNCCFWQLSCGIQVFSCVLFSPTFTNLHPEIKIDDSPVKGSKRGKGKKEKKKTVEPAAKKKPKLEELKVLGTHYSWKQII